MHLKKNYFFLPGVGTLKKRGEEGGAGNPFRTMKVIWRKVTRATLERYLCISIFINKFEQIEYPLLMFVS